MSQKECDYHLSNYGEFNKFCIKAIKVFLFVVLTLYGCECTEHYHFDLKYCYNILCYVKCIPG